MNMWTCISKLMKFIVVSGLFLCLMAGFACGSIAYIPVRTRLSKLQAEVKVQTNHNPWELALWLMCSSTYASDSNNLVLTES